MLSTHCLPVRFSFIALLLFALLALSFTGRRPYDLSQSPDPNEAKWVDSVFNALTEEERIGQLFMLRAHSDKDAAYEQGVEDLIRQYKVGGLCFFQGTPERQAELTNRYQAASRIPLLISMDAEYGLGMRLKETAITYPRQLMLGAIRDNALLYDMGREMARQCRRLGVHVNFSPVADINNNPANPVINDRSFGEDRYNVAAKCFQLMSGMQDGGILACAKHFPGHGDTNTDSHFDLPLIAHDTARLDSLELYPFRFLAKNGIGSVMVAHLNMPAFDPRPNRPTTLSRPVVTGLLRQKLDFQGLIFTDAMEMQGVTKYFGPGEADVEALRAGNDIVLLPANVGAAVAAVQRALADSTLDRRQMEASVRRVLRAKYRLGLTTPQRVEVANIRRDLNSPQAWLLKRRLVENALTLVRDRQGLAGFDHLERRRLAVLSIGDTNRTVFQTYCGYYAPIHRFNVPKSLDSAQARTLLDSLCYYDAVLVGLHNMRSKASDAFGLNDSLIAFINRLDAAVPTALTVFGNPYSLDYFEPCRSVLVAYNDDPITQELAAQAWFGARDLSGILPVSVSSNAKFGQGLVVQYPSKRMGYDLPEAVGMNSDTLAHMDDLVAELITAGAAPGCQILVVKDNKVVWQKAYGHLTYDSLAAPVTLDDLYDLASVTKIGATTISLMRLTDEGRFSLDKPMSAYVPELTKTNKKDLLTRDILAHHARLQAWIPFYQRTLHDGLPDQHIYHREPDEDSNIPVAPGMYMENAWVDTIWNTIFRSELLPKKEYKYSDLGLYLSARALQNITGQTLDQYADATFYRPMGLATTTFTPWKRGWVDRCVPTEEDTYFRHQRLQGYVHDMGAAQLGGVSGHAGLFSNANDLAKIFQMLLNGGEYFNTHYINRGTVDAWTTRYPGSTRRGIGFDMKELDPRASQNVSELAGINTFGHTGFTGIGVWADPDQRLIFVFLSNRTYPTMENNRLITGDYRPRLQSVVYRSLIPTK